MEGCHQEGHGQVTEVHNSCFYLKCVFIWPDPQFFINIYAAFLFQNPDKKKVLTSQRTFDSEGEKVFRPHTFRFI